MILVVKLEERQKGDEGWIVQESRVLLNQMRNKDMDCLARLFAKAAGHAPELAAEATKLLH